MRKKFDEQLDDLSQEMIYMGNLIEQAIENAVDALIHKNVEKAENIINSDDKIDNQERKIENLCLHLLLQQQPVAKDLRLISSTLKIIPKKKLVLNVRQLREKLCLQRARRLIGT